jgi:uncharacterized protein
MRTRWLAVLILTGLAGLTSILASCAGEGTVRAAGEASASSPLQQAPPPGGRRQRRAADPELAAYIRDHYVKSEHQIPMRDGARLFTIVYSPKNASPSRTYPFLMIRTPYSIGPYGPEDYRGSLGPSDAYARDGYIFVYQDVRGCHMSEGTFVNMTPHIDDKKSPSDVDESSDAYDTIDWLLANIPNHNGRVGLYGISYPGFYAAASMINAHPALKASSPQAPIADWWYDDFHHHGALFLPHAFNFLVGFGRARPEPTISRDEEDERIVEHGTPDGYQFFLDMGPLHNANDKYYKDRIAFWNDICAHPNYDDFWQARNLLPHLNDCAPAVMTVGGWFDAEDLYGALTIYQAVEAQNPGIVNVLVMGPWQHGGWNRTDGNRLGNILFDARTSTFYRDEIERPFFAHFLKDEGELTLPEAYVFETGANQWRTFDDWPPPHVTEKNLFVREDSGLSFEPPTDTADAAAYDEFISDPAKPVPFSEAIAIGMTREYMTDDQRFAARRPDVLAYQTPPLEEDITLAGPILAELWVSTSGTDSDWIVKLIDVFPPDAPDHDHLADDRHMGGYQMMVRSEVIRGRFRNSYEHPEPFTPNQPTYVDLPLQDVLHTFKKGHRIMVQIQSTWFPLVDRNPQKYVDNIYLDAREEDFTKATQRVYRGGEHMTCLRVGVLGPSAQTSPTESPSIAH